MQNEGGERHECGNCISLKEELRRIQEQRTKEQVGAEALKKFLDEKADRATRKSATLEEQLAELTGKVESLAHDNDNLRNQLKDAELRAAEAVEAASNAKRAAEESTVAQTDACRRHKAQLRESKKTIDDARSKAAEAETRADQAEKSLAAALKHLEEERQANLADHRPLWTTEECASFKNILVNRGFLSADHKTVLHTWKDGVSPLSRAFWQQYEDNDELDHRKSSAAAAKCYHLFKKLSKSKE